MEIEVEDDIRAIVIIWTAEVKSIVLCGGASKRVKVAEVWRCLGPISGSL